MNKLEEVIEKRETPPISPVFRKATTMKESKLVQIEVSASGYNNSKLGIAARASGKGSAGGGMRAAEMISFKDGDEVIMSSTVIDSFNYLDKATPHLGLPSHKAISSGVGDLTASDVDKALLSQIGGQSSLRNESQPDKSPTTAIQAFHLYKTMANLYKPTIATI